MLDNQIILTQISVFDIRNLFREELQNFFIETQNKESDVDEIGKGVHFASRITGKKPSTIYGLCSRREIPHFKRGGDLYFKKSELLAWLDEGKRRTVSEIKQQANNF